MKIQLLSYNVRGLNTPGAIEALRTYIFGIKPSLDIVMIQEHKLRLVAAQQLSDRLWKRAQAWCLEAEDDYNHLSQDAGAGRGGVITLLNPRWKQFVTQQGSI
jgi:exonuclease III